MSIAGNNDDSDTYSGVLGKRSKNDTSSEQLRAEIEGGSHEDTDEAGLDSSERRERR
jgi:hypothetical protein